MNSDESLDPKETRQLWAPRPHIPPWPGKPSPSALHPQPWDGGDTGSGKGEGLRASGGGEPRCPPAHLGATEKTSGCSSARPTRSCSKPRRDSIQACTGRRCAGTGSSTLRSTGVRAPAKVRGQGQGSPIAAKVRGQSHRSPFPPYPLAASPTRARRCLGLFRRRVQTLQTEDECERRPPRPARLRLESPPRLPGLTRQPVGRSQDRAAARKNRCIPPAPAATHAESFWFPCGRAGAAR